MKNFLFATTALTLAIISAPALAQADQVGTPQQAEEAFSDDAIVVTARRRAEDVSKVPVSISAFSEKVLEARGIQNLGDIVKITPGVNISGGGSRVNPFVTIRGQTRGVTGNVQAGVTSYLNEVPLSNNGSLIPTFDMDNVQVLKGPQGTLFGRNSLGGSVLVYTKAPTHSFSGYGKIDVASFDFRQFEGAINIPIISDVVALRVATQINHDGGFNKTMLVTDYTIDPVTHAATPGSLQPLAHNLDEFSTKSVRASLLIEPADGIKNVTVFDYSQTRGFNNSQFDQFWPSGFGGRPAPLYLQNLKTSGGDLRPELVSRFGAQYLNNLLALTQCGTSFTCDYRLAGQVAGANNRTQFINSDPWLSRARIWGITNTTTVNVTEGATLKNIFGYRVVDIFSNGDNEGSPLFVTQTAQTVKLKQISDELQLAGDIFDGKLKYTVGGFYFQESPNGPGGNSGLEVNALQGLSHSIATTYLTNTSKAVYGQIDYSLDWLVEGLQITAGARQTWDEVSGCASNVVFQSFANAMYMKGPNSSALLSEDQCKNNSVTPAFYDQARSVLSQNLPKSKFDKLTYTLGVNWQITSDAMIYGVHRRGYRGGSYNTPLFDPYLANIQTFQPETLEDWEVGTKLRWRTGGMRGSLDLAVFTGKDKGNHFSVGTSSLTNICVPQAVSASRPTNCNTTGGVAGVSITHPSATTIVNGGELTIRGFELATTFSPVDGLNFGLGVAHVDYRVDKVTLPANLLALLQAGNQTVPTTIILPQQPKWTYNADIDVRLPMKLLDSDVSFSANFKHSDPFLLGDITVKGYDVADARLTFANIGESGVDVAVYVRNLTNEDYNFGTAASSPTSTGASSFIHAPPRTVGMSLRYNFGS